MQGRQCTSEIWRRTDIQEKPARNFFVAPFARLVEENRDFVALEKR